jgi:hypothetical protein
MTLRQETGTLGFFFLKDELNLNNSDKTIIIRIQNLIPDNLFLKCTLPGLQAWWKDWRWNQMKGFKKYKSNNGYQWLSSRLALDAKFV